MALSEAFQLLPWYGQFCFVVGMIAVLSAGSLGAFFVGAWILDKVQAMTNNRRKEIEERLRRQIASNIALAGQESKADDRDIEIFCLASHAVHASYDLEEMIRYFNDHFKHRKTKENQPVC